MKNIKLYYFHANFRIEGIGLSTEMRVIFDDAKLMVSVEESDSVVLKFDKWIKTVSDDLLQESTSLLGISHATITTESIYVVKDHRDFNKAELKELMEMYDLESKPME